jgi:Fur family ferric uptake transcriptional regulator
MTRRDEGGTLAERMKARGLRLTWQRRLLAELLEGARKHLDAETVFRLARRRDPAIHRATVYRTLNSLKRLGLVDELDLMHVTGERHFYEVRPSAFHIHLVCTACGGVEEPGGAFWEDLKRRVETETGFAPEVVRLEMGGLCSRCRRRPARNRSRGSTRGTEDSWRRR